MHSETAVYEMLTHSPGSRQRFYYPSGRNTPIRTITPQKRQQNPSRTQHILFTAVFRKEICRYFVRPLTGDLF